MALELEIAAHEGWDAKKEEFVNTPSVTLRLEHSLVSLSKWESKHKKPYLKENEEKTQEEILDYIKCMTITQNVPDEVYALLTKQDMEKINSYIVDPMTATWFNENSANNSSVPQARRRKEQITSELIYYWMISYRIPMQCEKWHLNRLLTLIRIFSIKDAEANGKSNKMSKRDIVSQNRALNAARRKALGTKG